MEVQFFLDGRNQNDIIDFERVSRYVCLTVFCNIRAREDHVLKCVLLCDVQGYSYQEIADTLQIPKGTVMSRLFYARKKLQAQLADLREEAARV